jgi:tRNA(Ile)-lysidine synthase
VFDAAVIRPGDTLSAAGEALDGLFAPLRHASTVLVAVSGGPDSVALLHLLNRWRAPGSRPDLIAATVDHALRAESAAEAAIVAGWSAQIGIPHRILEWQGPKPNAGLQEAARKKRYELLFSEALRCGASHVAVAHTLDDQAETILMRVARGSGVAGLVGMRPEVDRDGMRLVRPLLGVPKASLVDLCRREGWDFVQDPSNLDERFARARWRKLLPTLAAEGLTPERLGQLAERARRVEDALDAKAREAVGRAGRGEGGVRLGGGLLDEPFEIAARMLALMLREGGEELDPLRLQRLERALERLRAAMSEGRPLRLTLAGRVIDLRRDGSLAIRPEPVRRRGRYPYGSEDDAGRPASLGKGMRRA